MKRIHLMAMLCLLLAVPCFGQIKEVDDSKTILGIRLYQKPEYSELKFERVSPECACNQYKISNKLKFKGEGYTISEGYVNLEQDMVMEITCVLRDSNDYKKVEKDLASAGFSDDGAAYRGQNVDFIPASFDGKPAFRMVGHEEKENLPKIKDTTGIIEMLGKAFTDSTVQTFMENFKNKPVKTNWTIKSGYDLSWKDEGVVMSFTGLGDDAEVSKIVFYLSPLKDIKKISSQTPMPYGITLDYNPMQLLDKFGPPDVTADNYYVTYKFDVSVYGGEIKVLRVY